MVFRTDRKNDRIHDKCESFSLHAHLTYGLKLTIKILVFFGLKNNYYCFSGEESVSPHGKYCNVVGAATSSSFF